MSVWRIQIITGGDEAPPAVGLAKDGVLLDAFSAADARLVAEHLARSAEGVDQLIAAGPPYPESNWRN